MIIAQIALIYCFNFNVLTLLRAHMVALLLLLTYTVYHCYYCIYHSIRSSSILLTEILFMLYSVLLVVGLLKLCNAQIT